MSRSASPLNVSGHGDADLTSEDVARWRVEVQGYFADTLAQLRDCIESLESQPAAPAPASPEEFKGEADAGYERRGSPPQQNKEELQDRRLAELAKRLDAKLRESEAPSSDPDNSIDGVS